ncbi:MAG TPA: Wzz/FepE/Etk N-terminal domain-containing protein [Ktedonobacterales bacterium]|jgi:uncharacterized protein involved in exopolysaccharide biosynthesis|nr:Wzz/FepE/Etk N-terminal domain-containing protein [Ktedonobacterales bacterium]
MTKFLEILFRNKMRLAALLLLPVLVSGIVVFFLPRSYQATARLLAERRYTVIGATGPESDLQSTPAVTQATALTEFLQTQDFDLAVAKDTSLAKQMNVPSSDAQRLNEALYAEISTHVSVTASGSNLFVVTYSNKDPVVAMQVVKAVVNHYDEQSAFYATTEGQQLLKSLQGQLDAAQAQADSATKAAAQYLNDNHLAADSPLAQSDPKYQALLNNATQANNNLQTIQNNFNSLESQVNSLNQGLFLTVDAPTVPTQPESRVKSLLIGGAVGLVIGLLAAIVYLLILVRLDQSVYSSADMPAITDYPVLIQIQKLPRRSATWITRTNSKLLTEKGA